MPTTTASADTTIASADDKSSDFLTNLYLTLVLSLTFLAAVMLIGLICSRKKTAELADELRPGNTAREQPARISNPRTHTPGLYHYRGQEPNQEVSVYALRDNIETTHSSRKKTSLVL